MRKLLLLFAAVLLLSPVVVRAMNTTGHCVDQAAPKLSDPYTNYCYSSLDARWSYWNGAAWVAVAPSPTPTPTATGTRTPTPTSTPSPEPTPI